MYTLSTFSLLLPLTLSSLPHVLAQTNTFPRDYASCAADPSVLQIFGPAPKVTVQPYCDYAINTICNTALETMTTGPTIQSLKATAINQDDPACYPCEVHLLFPSDTITFNGFTYDTCVQGFQGITVDCMLLDFGKWAQAGKQAGVRGVAHDAQGLESSVERPIWRAASFFDPGFMAGPPGYFGNVSVLDVSDRIPENVFRIPGQRRRRSLAGRVGDGVEL